MDLRYLSNAGIIVYWRYPFKILFSSMSASKCNVEDYLLVIYRKNFFSFILVYRIGRKEKRKFLG